MRSSTCVFYKLGALQIVWISGKGLIEVGMGPRPASTSACALRQAATAPLPRPLVPDCRRRAHGSRRAPPPVLAPTFTATRHGIILLQSGKRSTAQHSLLSHTYARRASSLCHVQRCSRTAHRRYSGPAVQSPSQNVLQPRVELSIQPRHHVEPHHHEELQ
jgi:hypothetical protein